LLKITLNIRGVLNLKDYICTKNKNVMMDLQLEITKNTQQLLQKEATEKNLPISKLVSNLIENYFSMRKWQKNQANSKQLLIELAQNETTLDMTEDELMDFINTEIKAARAEKYAH
jgi:hypothetical protein